MVTASTIDGQTNRDEYGSRPIPDPTLLTTQQLLREMANLKEVISTRLDAMDKATIVFNDSLVRFPTEVDKQITHLRELMMERIRVSEQKFVGVQEVVEERFDGVNRRFEERDTRAEQVARTSTEALQAALQAAKEAVAKQNESFVTSIAKSELATAKQIDQLILSQQASATALNDKIDDLKERLSRAESTDIARNVTKSEGRTASGLAASWTAAAIAALIATVATASLAIALHNSSLDNGPRHTSSAQ